MFFTFSVPKTLFLVAHSPDQQHHHSTASASYHHVKVILGAWFVEQQVKPGSFPQV